MPRDFTNRPPIAAAPLKSLVWASAIGRVKFKWRDNTEREVVLNFLQNLIDSAELEKQKLQ